MRCGYPIRPEKEDKHVECFLYIYCVIVYIIIFMRCGYPIRPEKEDKHVECFTCYSVYNNIHEMWLSYQT